MMCEVPKVEKLVGVETYLTKTPGIGGKLRYYPEDFIVLEETICPESAPDGRYTIMRVCAVNWETNRLIRAMARECKISEEHIMVAGAKDKRAVSVQAVSAIVPIEKAMSIHLPDFKIIEAYPSNTPIKLGGLVGNYFDIVVRNTVLEGKDLKAAIEETASALKNAGGFPNFFGIQRFGAVRPVTHIIGKYLVSGDYESAVKTYIAYPMPEEKSEASRAREYLQDTWDMKGALNLYPRDLCFERDIIRHLSRKPNDYIGALRALPKKLRMMFVHAFQSYVFNRVLSERIKRNIPLNIPIVGDIVVKAGKGGVDTKYTVKVTEKNIDTIAECCKRGRCYITGLVPGTDVEIADGVMGDIEKKIMEEEGIERKSFVIPELPELTSRGRRRPLIAPMKNLQIFSYHTCARFRFKLWPGSYATSLMREFMKGDVLDY